MKDQLRKISDETCIGPSEISKWRMSLYIITEARGEVIIG